jgi:hypothetical protein
MMKRLLLNRINTKTSTAAIRIEHHPASLNLAHKTKAAIPLLHPTLPRAQATNNPRRILAIDLPPLTR